jgi:hypothetical protein
MTDNTRDMIPELLRELRGELLAMRTQVLRVERRLNEVSSDIGVVVKLEVGNAMLRLDDKLDRIIDDHERRLTKLETTP